MQNVTMMSPADVHRQADPTGRTGEARPLRLVIADDHPFYRGRLAISLGGFGLEVVEEVGNGQAAIEAAEATDPDVVLMDLRMPLLSGVDATRRLTDISPGLRILAISATALEDEIADAILWGANGYVSKDRSLPELVDAIETIAAGRMIITAGTAQVLCRRIRGPVEKAPSLIGAPLIRRELELLGLLAAGKTVARIAAESSAPAEALHRDIEAIVLKLRIEQRIQIALQDAGNPEKDEESP
jgi:DNA-binding NarL/FixJ family response regulator